MQSALRFSRPAVFVVLFGVLTLPAMAGDQVVRKTITFPSQDDLPITADLYLAHKSPKTPFIVLFHQARWSRGEYLHTAHWFNEIGYNCMAVDLRGGDRIKGVPNRTAEEANERNVPRAASDASVDILAALAYARKEHAEKKLIALGSSYSASLLLRLAGEDEPGLKVNGVVAFSPGEYFQQEGKPADWVKHGVENIEELPMFIACTRRECESVQHLTKALRDSPGVVVCVPEDGGQHGSRALWRRFPKSGVYRKALRTFLHRHFPTNADERSAVAE